jgi:hypothetical protein
MDDDQGPASMGSSDYHKSLLFLGMERIGNRDRQRISENRRRFLEWHAMLPDIRPALLHVPFED